MDGSGGSNGHVVFSWFPRYFNGLDLVVDLLSYQLYVGTLDTYYAGKIEYPTSKGSYMKLIRGPLHLLRLVCVYLI